jgi:hypothetical protein
LIPRPARQLYCFAISAKRYTLFMLDKNGLAPDVKRLARWTEQAASQELGTDCCGASKA